MSKKSENNISKAEALRTLRNNADLTVPLAHKGKATVVLNTSDYTERVLALLDDPAYKELAG